MKMQSLFLAAALAVPAAAVAQTADNNDVETALTVYNQGPAVVWQTRELSLDAGRQTLAWPSAPATLLPESLWLAGDGVTLASASIPGAPLSPDALLARRIGQSVTLLATDGDEQRRATLVSVAGDDIVVRVDDRLELINGNSDWRVAWPAAQEGNGLQLSVYAQQGGQQPVTLAYQRSGVNWHASYTGRLRQGQLTLQSLAVIENTGSSVLQADRVALIAGSVARTSAPRTYMMARAASAKPATPEPQEVGGYYRYTLSQPVTIPAGATQVLALMNAHTFTVERQYRVEGAWYRGASEQRTHASIRLTFENTSGQPLPAGPVRVYGQQPAMLLGEDSIGNIPAGAPVTLQLGQAFDITATHRATASSADGDNHKRTLSVTLYNARDEAVEVTVVEHLPPDADIVDQSAEHESRSARKVVWQLAVPAGGKTVLTYSVRWTQ